MLRGSGFKDSTRVTTSVDSKQSAQQLSKTVGEEDRNQHTDAAWTDHVDKVHWIEIEVNYVRNWIELCDREIKKQQESYAELNAKASRKAEGEDGEVQECLYRGLHVYRRLRSKRTYGRGPGHKWMCKQADREKSGWGAEKQAKKQAQETRQEGDAKIAVQNHSKEESSASERPSPSYRLVQKNCPKLVSSHKTLLGASVLNDEVCLRDTSKDYFKHAPKENYEEKLLRCEDERFELDILIEQAAATIEKVTAIVASPVDMAFLSLGLDELNDRLSALNLGCIKRVCGKQALETIDALPGILVRLKQKHDEWSRHREEMKVVWAKSLNSGNCYRALR